MNSNEQFFCTFLFFVSLFSNEKELKELNVGEEERVHILYKMIMKMWGTKERRWMSAVQLSNVKQVECTHEKENATEKFLKSAHHWQQNEIQKMRWIEQKKCKYTALGKLEMMKNPLFFIWHHIISTALIWKSLWTILLHSCHTLYVRKIRIRQRQMKSRVDNSRAVDGASFILCSEWRKTRWCGTSETRVDLIRRKGKFTQLKRANGRQKQRKLKLW